MKEDGVEIKTRDIMDVMDMDMDMDEAIDEEEEEVDICTFVALNLDTGVEVSKKVMFFNKVQFIKIYCAF